MKKSVVTIFLLFSVLMSFSQNNKSSLIDTLLLETKAESSTKGIMSGIIKQFMSRKPNAPESLEQEIQNSIDYSNYMKKVKSAYDTAYTEAELKELIEIHQSGNQELFKQKSERVAKPLYDIGNKFGVSAVGVIKAKLQSY
jgi:hypothetical protein